MPIPTEKLKAREWILTIAQLCRTFDIFAICSGSFLVHPPFAGLDIFELIWHRIKSWISLPQNRRIVMTSRPTTTCMKQEANTSDQKLQLSAFLDPFICWTFRPFVWPVFFLASPDDATEWNSTRKTNYKSATVERTLRVKTTSRGMSEPASGFRWHKLWTCK